MLWWRFRRKVRPSAPARRGSVFTRCEGGECELFIPSCCNSPAFADDGSSNTVGLLHCGCCWYYSHSLLPSSAFVTADYLSDAENETANLQNYIIIIISLGLFPVFGVCWEMKEMICFALFVLLLLHMILSGGTGRSGLATLVVELLSEDRTRTGRLKTQEMTTWDTIAGLNKFARTFGIDHSDEFRSHFASVLVYCYLISFYVGTYCFVRLPVNNGVSALYCPS